MTKFLGADVEHCCEFRASFDANAERDISEKRY